MLADKLLKGGKGFKEDRERIAEGDTQVAKGEDRINVGERRLDAAKLELRRGREQLRLAKGARVACALGAAFFCLFSDCARVLLEAITGPDLYTYGCLKNGMKPTGLCER